MTESRFYKQALFLPATLTVVAWLLLWVDRTTEIFASRGEGLVGLAIVVGYGGLWAAVPYFIVAASVSFWVGRRKGPVSHEIQGSDKLQAIPYTYVLLGAPIAVIVVGNVLMLIIGAVRQDFSLSALAIFYSVWGLLLGYAYVLIIASLHLVGTKAGWVRPD